MNFCGGHRSGLVAPEQPKPRSVPPSQRPRSHDHQRISPIEPQRKHGQRDAVSPYWLPFMSVNTIKELRHVVSGPQGSRLPSVDADRVTGLRSLATPQREIETMFANIVAAVKHKVVGWVQAVGNLLMRITKPMSTAARLAAGAGRDMSRSTAELLAENALLRQQIIVLRRTAGKPRLKDHERLLMGPLFPLQRRMAAGAAHRQARHAASLAQSTVQASLEAQVKTQGPARTSRPGDHRSDSNNAQGQPLGR